MGLSRYLCYPESDISISVPLCSSVIKIRVFWLCLESHKVTVTRESGPRWRWVTRVAWGFRGAGVGVEVGRGGMGALVAAASLEEIEGHESGTSN